jgi:hypothetical protein
VDLDPAKSDGDELVIVAPGQLTIAKIGSNGRWQPQPSQPFDGGAPNDKPIKVLSGDFDNSGTRDVLVIFAGSSPDAPIAAVVYFNDGQGHLGSPVPVPLQGARAVTTMHATSDPGTQIVAVGSFGVQIIKGPLLAPLPPTAIGSFPDAIDCAAGDINGDGLEDLVVASKSGQVSSFQVLLGTVAQ